MVFNLHSESLNISVHSFGAELMSIQNKNGQEFLWQGDPAIWPRRAPVLFPVVGKLVNQRYRFEGIDYSLAQHGFARDTEMRAIFQNEQELIFELLANDATRAVFPFEFSFQVGYKLEGNHLRCNYKVKNKGSNEMYFSVGAHPGFNLPEWDKSGAPAAYLQMEATQYQCTLLESGLLSEQHFSMKLPNKQLKLSPELFSNDALVFENNQVNSLSLIIPGLTQRIDLQCKSWPYFGIWSRPDPVSKQLRFVCLEPWHGVADTTAHDGQILNKKGIIALGPESDFACSYELFFH